MDAADLSNDSGNVLEMLLVVMQQQTDLLQRVQHIEQQQEQMLNLLRPSSRGVEPQDGRGFSQVHGIGSRHEKPQDGNCRPQKRESQNDSPSPQKENSQCVESGTQKVESRGDGPTQPKKQAQISDPISQSKDAKDEDVVEVHPPVAASQPSPATLPKTSEACNEEPNVKSAVLDSKPAEQGVESQFDRIDDGLLLQILQRLPQLDEVAYAAGVCRRWNALLKQIAKYLTRLGPFLANRRIDRLILRFSPHNSLSDLHSLLAHLQHLPSLSMPAPLHELNVGDLDVRQEKDWWSSSLLAARPNAQTIAPGLPSLQVLTLVGANMSIHTIQHMKQLTALTSLVMWGVTDKTGGGTYPALFATLVKLTTLRKLDLAMNFNFPGIRDIVMPAIARITSITALRFLVCGPPFPALRHLARLTGLESLQLQALDFSHSDAPRDALSFIGAMTQLTTLNLFDAKNRCPHTEGPPLQLFPFLPSLKQLQGLAVPVWTSEDIEAVARCRQLTFLELRCALEDEDELEAVDFDPLGALKALKYLILRDFPCCEPAAEAIVDALPHLEHVGLKEVDGKKAHHCPMVEHFARLKKLRPLDLLCTQVTPKSLRRLSFRTDLECMSLSEINVSPALLQEITAIKSLQVLDVSECSFERLGVLKILLSMPNLKTVLIPGTRANQVKSTCDMETLAHIP